MTAFVNFHPPLAAAWEFWVYGILGLLSIVGWIIRQVSQAQQKKEQEQRRQRMPPARVAPAQPQAQRPPQPQRPQAVPPRPQPARGGMPVRPQAPAAQGGPSSSPLESFLQEMARHLEPPQAQPQPRPVSPPLRREPVELEESELAAEDRGRSVRQHVDRYMDSHEFSQRKQHLAKGVREEVAALKAGVQQKFDHQVGTMHAEQATPAENSKVQELPPGLPVAASILAILSNPRQVRSAIILNEILQRPRMTR